MPEDEGHGEVAHEPAVRSSFWIAQTPIWQVNDDSTRMIVAGRIRLSEPFSVSRVNGLRMWLEAIGWSAARRRHHAVDRLGVARPGS